MFTSSYLYLCSQYLITRKVSETAAPSLAVLGSGLDEQTNFEDRPDMQPSLPSPSYTYCPFENLFIWFRLRERGDAHNNNSKFLRISPLPRSELKGGTCGGGKRRRRRTDRKFDREPLFCLFSLAWEVGEGVKSRNFENGAAGITQK